MSFLFGSKSNKTIKPKKNADGVDHFQLMKQKISILCSGDLHLVVKLPEGEDLNEWIAVNSKI
jgi:MOB kinase activator 1